MYSQAICLHCEYQHIASTNLRDFSGKFSKPIAHNITRHVTSPTAPVGVVFARKSGMEGDRGRIARKIRNFGNF